MDKYRRKKIGILLIIILILCATVVGVVASSQNGTGQNSGTAQLGAYTFDRQMTLDSGETVDFYESGDQRYHYFHDKDGFILLREQGALNYAICDGGKPVNSGISVVAPKNAINNLKKMTVQDVDFEKNPDLLMDEEYKGGISNEPLMSASAATGTTTIYNVIIYIMFEGESESVYTTLANNPNEAMLNGDISLKDYFHEASFGKMSVNSIMPKQADNGLVYVYKDKKARSYYNVRNGSPDRARKESELLGSAIKDAEKHFNFNNIDLDSNDDGYVDSVGFLVSNSAASDWANLLWPHAWSFSGMGSSAALNGINVNEYSFNFSGALNVGLLCHEFFHVMGAPDLYHYDDNYTPVGKWDIMESNQPIPQFMTTYMRDKYLKAVNKSQIGEIKHNGVYSLNPIERATGYSTLAYKIPTNKPNQYFMVEYRNPNISAGYDSSLSGAGLIIYRINTSAKEGNRNARYRNPNYPDELFVFRPREGAGKDDIASSASDVERGYLSPSNAKFKAVGASLKEKPVSSTAKFDPTTLFYSDGTNSGIKIEALSINNNSVEFRVSLNGENNIEDDYFDDKITLSAPKYINAEFSGISANIALGDIDPTFLSNIIVKAVDTNDAVYATNTLSIGKFLSEFNSGIRNLACSFVISDKGNIQDTVFLTGGIASGIVPTKLKLYVVDADKGTERLLSTTNIDTAGLSWSSLLETKTELKASLYADSRITLGVKTDGTAVASGTNNQNQWAVAGHTNIISASVGLTHTLLLNKDLRVIALGNNVAGELNVAEWRNIKAVSAGTYTSYGLDIDGLVYATGRNTYGQLNTGTWQNIIAISAGDNHIAAVTASGAVVAVGDNKYGQTNVESFANIIAVSSGDTFTAVLTAQGTVMVAGTLIKSSGQTEVENWHDIVKISAGKGYLVGLKSDGTVVAVGDNSYGQASTTGLIDIVEIAAAEFHTAYLRIDGTVQYKGVGNSAYGTNDELDNLKYSKESYIKVSDISFSIPQTTAFVGDRISANTSITPTNATYKRLIFTSSNESIATVAADGTINCLAVGVVTITARANGTNIVVNVEFTVNEVVALQSIRFADDSKNIKIGGTSDLLIKVTPTNATLKQKITFRSESPNVVSVSAAGVVTGLKLGEAVIVAELFQDGFFYSARCTIVVSTNIEKIEWASTPTKKIYKYGEALDVRGGKIIITAEGAQTTVTQSITEDMLLNSGYNPKKIGEQTLKIQYMGKELAFTVEVKDYIKNIEISTLPQTKFKFGEAFNTFGGKITRYMASGAIEVVDLQKEICKGYNGSEPSMQTIIVTYKSEIFESDIFTVTYDVAVEDTVRSIKSNLVTKSYNWLSDIDMTQTIILEMSSGRERQLELSETIISDYNNKRMGAQTITVSYTDPISDKTFQITEKITIYLAAKFVLVGVSENELGAQEPYLYTAGQPLNFDVQCIVGDKTLQIPKFEENSGINYDCYYKIENFIPEGGTDSYEVLVKIFFRDASAQVGTEYSEQFSRAVRVLAKKPIQSGKIVLPKNIFKYGEELDVKLEITYKDQTKEVITLPSNSKIVYDRELVDTPQPLTVEYMGLTFFTEILIQDYIIGIKPIPSLSINYGETVTPDCYMLYASGAEKKPAAGTLALKYDNTILNRKQTVTVTYTYGNDTYTATFELTILDTPKSIAAVGSTMKLEYKYGEALDPTSVYTVTYLSGAVSTINFSYEDFTISALNSTSIGTQTVTVRYLPLGTIFNFRIEVKNYCTALVVNNGSALQYNYGEELKISVTAKMANGESRIVTDFTTNYNSKKLGIQNITITYGDVSVLQEITVTDIVKTMTMTQNPGKQDYEFGEALLYSGAAIKVVYESGREETYENSAIAALNSSYNPTRAGSQVVRISLGGKEVVFSVRVAKESEATKKIGDFGGALRVDEQNKRLVIKSGILLEALLKEIHIAAYLNITVADVAGEGISNPTTFVPCYSVVQVLNKAGQIIYKYTVIIVGDLDSSGEFNSDDLDDLANEYLKDSPDKDAADYDGDGAFSLTDIVNWARKAAKSAESTNAPAKAFVSAIRQKEDGSEEIM